MPALTIGRLARQAGVNLQTVRYYQRRRLLKAPAKPRNGYRVYEPEAVNRLRFIKRAQQLGFTLNEIRELLDLGDGHCDDVQTLAQSKQMLIKEQIRDLRRMDSALSKYLRQCWAGRNTGHCSLIEALYNSESSGLSVKKKGS